MRRWGWFTEDGWLEVDGWLEEDSGLSIEILSRYVLSKAVISSPTCQNGDHRP
ncbi:hypothetical protein HPP92_001804 [Vanilla planifolia]|uniref:Uncharacterized protein n=1 Tax=Vanilla planifolia TaxID=51239 RepID=A0A835RUN9_VANPL|nr:hypothetical protein HPP92_001804 [Vanilla planifolia]